MCLLPTAFSSLVHSMSELSLFKIFLSSSSSETRAKFKPYKELRSNTVLFILGSIPSTLE